MHKKLIMQDSILKMAGFQKSHTQLNKEPYFGMERKKMSRWSKQGALFFSPSHLFIRQKGAYTHRELAKGLRF